VKVLFVVSLALIFFAYAGYPACLLVWTRIWPRPIRRSAIFPSVTVVMAVHNEEINLPSKLLNLAALRYPAELLKVIVVSDGSTDCTNQILAAWQESTRQAVLLAEHQGKANALNQGVARAQGELICFTDARQTLAPDGLIRLVENFADPSVGCASGALVIIDQRSTPSNNDVSLYWQLEKSIRNWEGLSGSTVGATGAFYAIRKSLFLPLPAGIILDDVYLPIQVARQGSRVIFDSQAVAWDDFTPSPKQEFRRKVRTLAGNYQLLRIAPWLLTGSNPLLVQFVCHKLLRLLVPFALVGVLVSNLWFRTGLYGLALVLQAALYLLAALTIWRPKLGRISRLSNVALEFVVLNAAALVAFLYFITGRKVLWAR
jgi:cellulose synthase/poly-beta-1,6-N-acetylglucosamine synthase-like glycosyltransferase